MRLFRGINYIHYFFKKKIGYFLGSGMQCNNIVIHFCIHHLGQHSIVVVVVVIVIAVTKIVVGVGQFVIVVIIIVVVVDDDERALALRGLLLRLCRRLALRRRRRRRSRCAFLRLSSVTCVRKQRFNHRN
jgi:hypothetical protein